MIHKTKSPTNLQLQITYQKHAKVLIIQRVSLAYHLNGVTGIYTFTEKIHENHDI